LYDCFFVDAIIHHFLWGLYTIILLSFLPQNIESITN
jgi:hypothetical protein